MYKNFAIIFTLLFNFSAYAHIISAEVVSIAPFGIENVKGGNKGIHFEYLDKVLKLSGHEYNINIKPYPRVLSNLKKNIIHLTLIYKQNSIPKELELCKSIGFKNFIVSTKENKLSKTSELKNKVIGIIRDAKYEDNFDNDNSIKRIDLKSYSQGLKMLKLKRLDGLAISEPALKYFGKDARSHLAKPLYLNTKFNYLYGSKKLTASLSDKICAINNKLLNSNYLLDILSHY